MFTMTTLDLTTVGMRRSATAASSQLSACLVLALTSVSEVGAVTEHSRRRAGPPPPKVSNSALP